MDQDKLGSKDQLKLSGGSAQFYRLDNLEKQGIGQISRLPFSIKILLEQTIRNLDHFQVNESDILALANWQPKQKSEKEIPFKPTRVILQDLTGVPAIVDLASLRTSMSKLGGNPAVINPKIPVDLIIDHSIQVDSYGKSSSLQTNMEKEFERNRERYEFLKWGQKNFKNMKIFPPGVGIVHQVNLESLASVVQIKDNICFSDTVVGTDSHTPMVNGLGVLGWGVGGIEAESVMLGQPIYMQIPQVVGFKLTGEMGSGTTATDLVFRIVEILRQVGVVEKFVEFYGDGLSQLSLADRATISNMAPEYGATMGFFPTDMETLQYLKSTGRAPDLVERVEHYCKAQGLFRTDGMTPPDFSDEIELDLSTIEPSLAGPKRPQDRIGLSEMKGAWAKTLTAPVSQRGYELKENELSSQAKISPSDSEAPFVLEHGSVVLAAITSCTNTSNPSVMIAAGLLAKKAVEKGLKTKPWVKTSLAPGSRVVTDYLNQAKLDGFLEQLGFFTVGYGCTSCIGNSGPLSEPISKAITSNDLVVASVLSGNRNFEGRVNPLTKANYLASPPLVVAYAIAGTVNINILEDPLGTDPGGQPVYLKDIWPDPKEIAQNAALITPDMYLSRYSNFETLSPLWNEIPTKGDEVFEWDESSTYIRNPPFFLNMSKDLKPIREIIDARVLVKVGDSVTTDHISPAGAIAKNSPAATYLLGHGIQQPDFNSYGSRRGNDQVMVRGTFANIRLRNQLAPGTEGGITTYLPTGEQTSIFEASEKYKASKTPLIVLAGKEYGTGSSRDWAAKGTYLLGVKAVIASSYERIHRSNLLGMGVLPLQFKDGNSAESLNLTGKESYSILGLNDQIKPGQDLTLKVDDKEIPVVLRLDTPVEIEYYRNGGILHTVLRNFIKDVG
ncbi:aconitate hydratase AcnA [uncultured Desulfobacter sp.]|uniref:aconitate hydratase AcnA n=1 Tax=uncultured Desulfobacter sp. TaxID=240139 RepID=UPI002AAB9CB6|nr:aconitate hydratase AcnA [uncultured Desulfobacter sp.]